MKHVNDRTLLLYNEGYEIKTIINNNNNNNNNTLYNNSIALGIYTSEGKKNLKK